jgi:hypothetical protein
VLRRGAKPADQVDKKAYNSTAQTVDNSNPLLGTICSFSNNLQLSTVTRSDPGFSLRAKGF